MTDNEALEYFYGQMERGNIKNDTMQIAYERAIEALEEKMKQKMKIRIPLVIATHETKHGSDSYVKVIKKGETVADVIKAMQEECDYDEDNPCYNEYFASYTDAIVIDTDDFEEVK